MAALAWVKRKTSLILPRGRFARSVAVLAGGTALGQAITVLVSPVLTRLYTPEDFGVFGVYASILGIVTVVASLRYEYAIPLPEDDQSAANILALCFVLLLGMTTLSWFVIHGLGSQIVTWANVPGLQPYLWLIPLGMLGAGTYQILNYWAVRKRDFPRIAQTRLSRGVARAALQVGVGLVNSGPLGLLLGQLAGEAAGSTSLLLAVWKKFRTSVNFINLREIRKAGSRYRRFLFFSTTADLLNALGSQVPQLLFAAFYGAEIAGWFAFSARVIAGPLNIVMDSVSQVYFGEAAHLLKCEPKTVRRLFFKLIGRLVLFGSLPIAVICILAPWFFTIIFGNSWEMAGRYTQVMGIMFAVRFVIAPLGHTLTLLERQDLYLVQDGIRLVLTLGALLVGKAFGVSHITAVGLYTVAIAASTVFFGWLLWRVLNSGSDRTEGGGGG